MKQNIFEIIAFIFDNIAQKKIILPLDQKQVMAKLKFAGFEKEMVQEAFDWLNTLVASSKERKKKQNSKSFRVYSFEENIKINMEARSFIMKAEQIGILNTKSREIVINQLLQLEQLQADLNDAKWAILLTLLSQPEKASTEQLSKFLLEITVHKD